MDGSNTTDKDRLQMCKLCNSAPRRYTCPKCEISYCSLECYKSEKHMECSESFYKNWVESELRSQERDPEVRQSMMDVLKGMHASSVEVLEDDCIEDSNNDEDPASFMDSDDEEDIPDLAERLESVNLDNADELWAVLTDAERQEFEATVRNGEVTNFLPKWIPWWSTVSETKIIEELDEKKTAPDYVTKCPEIIDVPTFNELSKASPFVRFNLLNVLHAYTYTSLHCNGDHQSSPRESITIFLQLSDNMRENKVYEDSSSAIESVFRRIIECPLLSGDEETNEATKYAVNLIMKGPVKSNSTFYILAALSDLHRLFTNVKKTRPCSQEKSTDQTFTKRFCAGQTGLDLTKKTYLMCTKKIEYYLSWVKRYGMTMNP